MVTRSNWSELRRQRPLNERRLAHLRAALEVSLRLEELRVQRRVAESALREALRPAVEILEVPPDREDLFPAEAGLVWLASYVEALGGRLHLEAVFPGASVALLGPSQSPGAR